MTYSKPIVEIVKFDTIGFMTSSFGGYSSGTDAASQNCTGFNGTAKKFTCDVFANGDQVVYGDYTFYYSGNHWHCHGVK